MGRWVIFALLLTAASIYASSSLFSSTDEPLRCGSCHAREYAEYLAPINDSDLPVHREKNITCIDCHSPPGLKSSLTARKFLIDLQLVNYSLPAINRLFQANFTFNRVFKVSDFSVFKADCIKCHQSIGTKSPSFKFNHSSDSACGNCHLMHKVESTKSGNASASFWKHLGLGGHRNLTCGDCHGTEPTLLTELPQCTKCHEPHLKGAQWDRSICLGCHSDPHLPVKNAVFKSTLAKELCAGCHNDVYTVLTTNNSRHNNLPSCVDCHPKHMEVKSCVKDCHNPHGPLHPGPKNCNSCHTYVSACTDCHANPHAPLNDLPKIPDSGSLEEYAKTTGSQKRG